VIFSKINVFFLKIFSLQKAESVLFQVYKYEVIMDVFVVCC